MSSSTTIRKKIIRQVEKASDSELQSILKCVEALREREKRKQEFLSLAGSWSDMPKDFIRNLTSNLSTKRRSKQDLLK